MATLQSLLDSELTSQGESPEDIESTRVSVGDGWSPDNSVEQSYDDLAEYEGDTGFGGERLPRLLAWTDDRVYFKVVYDGAESIGSAPRNPAEEIPGRYGGG